MRDLFDVVGAQPVNRQPDGVADQELAPGGAHCPVDVGVIGVLGEGDLVYAGGDPVDLSGLVIEELIENTARNDLL